MDGHHQRQQYEYEQQQQQLQNQQQQRQNDDQEAFFHEQQQPPSQQQHDEQIYNHQQQQHLNESHNVGANYNVNNNNNNNNNNQTNNNVNNNNSNSGVPAWLRRLRRIDKNLASSVNASLLIRTQIVQQYQSQFDPEQQYLLQQQQLHEDREYEEDMNNIGDEGVGTSAINHNPEQQQQQNNYNNTLISPNLYSPLHQNQPKPVKTVAPTTDNSTNSVARAHGVEVKFHTKPGKFTNNNNTSNNPSSLIVPPSVVSTCIICRSSPREMTILEDEVARLRAFVAVQRESFQAQLDDLKTSHANEMKSVTRGAQTELNDRLVAYRREVDELRKHLSMAESAVLQLAKLKQENADLSKRYQMLVAANAKGGSVVMPFSANNNPATSLQFSPASMISAVTPLAAAGGNGNVEEEPSAVNRRLVSNNNKRLPSSSASPFGKEDWEIEKMELEAELEHWKRQATIAGVAANTAVGVSLRQAASNAENEAQQQKQQPQNILQEKSASRNNNNFQADREGDVNDALSKQISAMNNKNQQPGAFSSSTASSSSQQLHQQQQQQTSVNRLEAWRKEVNTGKIGGAHVAIVPSSHHHQQHQLQQHSSTSLGKVTLTTTKPGSNARPQNSIINNVELVSPMSTAERLNSATPPSMERRRNIQPNEFLGNISGGSKSSYTTTLSQGSSNNNNNNQNSSQLDAEKQRWLKLMEAISGSK